MWHSSPRRDGSAGWDGSWVIGWVEWRMGGQGQLGFTPLFSAWGTRRGWAWLASLCSGRETACAVGKMAGQSQSLPRDFK